MIILALEINFENLESKADIQDCRWNSAIPRNWFKLSSLNML